MSINDVFETFPELILDDNFYLREQKLSDTEDFLEYYSKPEVSRFILANIPQSISEAHDEILYWINIYKRKSAIYWAIARRSDNKMIGALGFNDWDRYNNRAELSYDLAPEYWNQGITSKAVKAVCDFAFEALKINRVQASTLKENVASIKLLEKCGFSLDGILKSYRYYQGRYYDIYMYSLTHKIWQNDR